MIDISALKEDLIYHGQAHIFELLPDLTADSRIIQQLTRECRNWQTTLKNYAAAASLSCIDLQAVKPLQSQNVANWNSIESSNKQELWEIGVKAVNSGQVAVVIMSGGQGTRLGFDGPKGKPLS